MVSFMGDYWLLWLIGLIGCIASATYEYYKAGGNLSTLILGVVHRPSPSPNPNRMVETSAVMNDRNWVFIWSARGAKWFLVLLMASIIINLVDYAKQ
jgi:hypothetical protein